MPRILTPALLVIGIAAYAQESSDKPIISLLTVSKLDHSQAGIYRTEIGKIDVIAVSVEDAAQKGYIVAPDHLPFPGLGHIRKDGHAYTWVPVDYVNDAVEK